MFVVLSISFIGCNRNEKDILDPNEVKETMVESNSMYNLMDYSPNVYHDYFKETNNKFGISALKANSFLPYSMVKNVSLTNNSQNFSFLINNKNYNNQDLKKEVKIGNDIYGKTNKFTIISEDKSGKTSEKDIDLYVPELINIKNPKVKNEKQAMPVCYSEGFVLEWNADSLNEEGLVIIVEYFGENVIPSNNTNEHLQNIDMIEEDNGKIVLKSSIFNNIPNLALVDLILLRGNVKIEEINGESYKFYAESHQRLPIILVKDLSTIKRAESN